MSDSEIMRGSKKLKQRIFSLKIDLEKESRQQVSFSKASEIFAENAMLPQDDLAKFINVMSKRPFRPFGKRKK